MGRTPIGGALNIQKLADICQIYFIFDYFYLTKICQIS